jgi:hypothetical protein
MTDHTPSMLKVVYFDDQTASDYLDITAGGNSATTTQHVQTRTTDLHAAVETKVAAKLAWLPFVGASADAGAGVDAGRVGQNILSKTLSNTILTDYLEKANGDDRIQVVRGFRVSATEGSMAHTKMYTPYMLIARTEEHGIDLARLDEALEKAKGYYELLATSQDEADDQLVLRFNIAAFRNNYGLADLGRMELTFHAIRVGRTTDLTFGIEDPLERRNAPPTASELLDRTEPSTAPALEVFDVVLAGVEHAG